MLDGTGRYHGTMPITVKELSILPTSTPNFRIPHPLNYRTIPKQWTRSLLASIRSPPPCPWSRPTRSRGHDLIPEITYDFPFVHPRCRFWPPNHPTLDLQGHFLLPWWWISTWTAAARLYLGPVDPWVSGFSCLHAETAAVQAPARRRGWRRCCPTNAGVRAPARCHLPMSSPESGPHTHGKSVHATFGAQYTFLIRSMLHTKRFLQSCKLVVSLLFYCSIKCAGA
jgi:hypothetical protein